MLNLSSFAFSCTFTRILLALLLVALRLPAAAQAPTWQSARAVGVATAAAAGTYTEVTATAIDAAGNVFLTGYFRNTMVLGGTTLTSLGGYDLFVAKFNPANSQFLWVQRAGGTGTDYAFALVVSGTSVYVAGTFEGPTASFGPATLTNAGSADGFVAKLTDAGSTGSFTWAQQAGGTDYDTAAALAVSGTSVYVAGNFNSSTIGFGPATLTNAGGNDAFVAKLTDAGSTGSFVWAQRAGGTGSDAANKLAVSGTSVYVVGDFNSSAGFGPITLTSVGSADGFVAKLTDAGSTGSFVWAQRAGGTGYDSTFVLAISGTSVYVAGFFNSSTADFGPATLTNAGTVGTADVFVAKITDAGSTGSFVWAQRAGGTGYDAPYALAVSGNSVYVAGTFASSTVGFGSATLTSAGSYDVFVAKLTDAGSTGSFVWSQRAGGSGREEAYALAVSGASVYVAGTLDSPTADFGTTTLTNPNPGTRLGFLAALTDPTLTATAANRALAPAQLFPNPARRTATLRLPAGVGPAPLTLTDALGRAVRYYPAPAGPEAVLDLRDLPAGLYLLRGAGPAQRLAVE